MSHATQRSTSSTIKLSLLVIIEDDVAFTVIAAVTSSGCASSDPRRIFVIAVGQFFRGASYASPGVISNEMVIVILFAFRKMMIENGHRDSDA